MSGFDRLFAPPPTTEQLLAEYKRVETVLKAALPLLREARDKLREMRGIGFHDGDERLRRAQRHLAVLEEDVLTMLSMPPRVD